MGTGASKARREANKQRAKALYEALQKAERMKPVRRADTSVARDLDEAAGGSVSLNLKAKARKADKLAREINAAEKEVNLNARIGRFNERYDIMKRQLAGESVSRFVVSKEADRSGVGMLATRNTPQEFDTNQKFFSDADSANKELQTRKANEPRGLLPPGVMGTQQAKKLIVQEQKLGPITMSHRTVNTNQGAFDELKAYATDVNTAPSAGLRERYGALAQKLQAGIKRIDSSPKNVGLLTEELAGASGPLNEVIR